MRRISRLRDRASGSAASSPTETDRVRGHYDARAGRYDRRIRAPERLLFGGGRAWACGQVSGAVLELAIGTGRNLHAYPCDIRLTGVELSPEMLAVARGRARRVGRSVELRVGDAQELDFADGSFDTVVATLALCTIPDPRRAVDQAFRVLRPGGRLVLLEHVRSPNAMVRGVQRLLDPLFVRLEADHLLREPLEPVLAAGFEVESLERSKLGLVERLIARKPDHVGTGADAD